VTSLRLGLSHPTLFARVDWRQLRWEGATVSPRGLQRAGSLPISSAMSAIASARSLRSVGAP